MGEERGEIPTTSGHRIDAVPNALRLGRAVSVSREESFSNELGCQGEPIVGDVFPPG
jgi:hypothetical protein